MHDNCTAQLLANSTQRRRHENFYPDVQIEAIDALSPMNRMAPATPMNASSPSPNGMVCGDPQDARIELQVAHPSLKSIDFNGRQVNIFATAPCMHFV